MFINNLLSDRIIGTWGNYKDVHVSANDVDNYNPYYSITTFNSDGSARITANSVEFQGSWEHIGGRSYKLTQIGVSKTQKIDFLGTNKMIIYNGDRNDQWSYYYEKIAWNFKNISSKNLISSFENKTNFYEHLDYLVETNVYRITQEAVNIVIKYSKSNFILVNIKRNKDILSITIEDDGIGFDLKKVKKVDSGKEMGLLFMEELVKYIDGRLIINSEKDKGTRIVINMYPD